jgi:voltage-gated potassium channel
MSGSNSTKETSLRERLYIVIFEHQTKWGRVFDELLLLGIVLSVAAVVLESVDPFRARFGTLLRVAEWTFTVLFTAEFATRVYCARDRRGYLLSFFGFVDLLALLPSYVSVLVPGAQTLLVVRVLRLLRVFRILKLVQFHGQADVLLRALFGSLPKITVFLGVVLTIVVIMGSTMYLVEGPENGFHSIPEGMYWAVVTMTTVGFGDITPQTPWGRFLASLLMVMGYAIIAVPTGIMSSEIIRAERAAIQRKCPSCQTADHRQDARFCRLCGVSLE